jgi:hypothetical protein
MASLDTVRLRLLDLHKALIDTERREHERTLGRLSGGEWLEALISDPAFAWLAPLTALIVRLDELQAQGEREVDPAPIRELLSPGGRGSDFQRRYADFLHRSPQALVAHGQVLRALKNTDKER